MNEMRVLIVEDDILIAMDLETIIAAAVPAVFTIKVSVAGTKAVLGEPFDFAFLDVDVTNGKTFDVADALSEMGVPFAFVSASRQSHLPDGLRTVPFVPKPFTDSAILAVLPRSGSRAAE